MDEKRREGKHTAMMRFFRFVRELFFPRIAWKLHVVILDGADRTYKADIPLKEAVAFIEKFSKFRVELTVVESGLPHSTFSYLDNNGTPVYQMLRDQIHPKIIANLPVAHSYLFLYKLYGNPPAQAGSTMGVADGIPVGGKSRPYATVCTDVWWYNNEPAGGFNSRAASILAHEIINTINCVTEVAPYYCPPLIGENSPDPYITEGNRLKVMGDACYKQL